MNCVTVSFLLFDAFESVPVVVFSGVYLHSMRCHLWLLLLVCITILVAGSKALRIGVVVFPELGHFNPIMSVVEAASNHEVDIYIPKYFFKTCIDESRGASHVHCIGYPAATNFSQYNEEFFQRLVTEPALATLSLVNQEADKFNVEIAASLILAVTQQQRPDVFLVDFGSWAGLPVADKLGIPTVLVWPLTLAFPLTRDPAIPALGSALSKNMTYGQRIFNFMLQRLSSLSLMRANAMNTVRLENGLPPVDMFDMYFRRIIITPSIFGFDLAQPLCPNVAAVGFLSRPTKEPQVISQDWTQWLNTCETVVYINLGSVAVLPHQWLTTFEEAVRALTNNANKCVVWKLSTRHHAAIDKKLFERPHVRITNYLPFSPRTLLQHPSTRTFVTHCGDTSVYEAIDAQVPMVGLPLFADQPDVCARLHDAGVGVRIDKQKLSAAAIVDAVEKIDKDREEMRRRLADLREMGYRLGGAKRAVQIIERTVRVGAEKFFCKHVDLPWYQYYDIDVMAVLAVVLVTAVWIVTRVLKLFWRIILRMLRSSKKSKTKVE